MLDDELPDGETVMELMALARITVVGMVAQVVLEDVMALATAPVAIAGLKAPNARKPSAPSAPSAAGPMTADLMIGGLTRATSFRSASRQDRPCCPGSSQYSRSRAMLVRGSRLTPKVH